jgi:hypothetical protein
VPAAYGVPRPTPGPGLRQSQAAMTETLQRPLRPSPTRPVPVRTPARPRARAAVTGALWAAGAGLVVVCLPVLLAWATDARAGAGPADALRTGAHVWLVAHGCTLSLGEGAFGLTPLGLLALPLLLLARAGTSVGRECGAPSLRSAAALTAAIAGPYALVATVVAASSATSAVRPFPLEALAAALLVAVTGAGLGVARGARLLPALRDRVPAPLRRVLRGVVGAVAVLLGAGALLVGVSLGLHLGRARELTGASSPGLVGGVALLLVGVALAPNAVVWGAAWLSGPGFALGAGTALSPFAHALGPVPALPLLAALPAGGVPEPWGLLALLVPVAAGAVAGVLVERGRASGGWVRSLVEAAATGPCAALLLGALAWLAGGPVGGGRLAVTGPSPVAVALAVGTAVSVVAVAAAAVVRRRR